MELYKGETTGLKKIVPELFNLFFQYIPSWLFIVPLSLLIPSKKGFVLFIGRLHKEWGEEFSGNVKYLFIHALKSGYKKIVFLTSNRDTWETLKKEKIPVLFYPSLSSIWALIRTELIIVDGSEWIGEYRQFFLFPSRKIQLWHGVGFKFIELCEYRGKSSLMFFLRRVFKAVKQSSPRYDLVVSTSAFYTENVFSKCFRWRYIKEPGYSRCDIFFRKPDDLDLIGSDREIINNSRSWKNRGWKIIIYAPTFREGKMNSSFKDIFDLRKLDDFCEAHKIKFVLKGHPEQKLGSVDSCRNLWVYEESKDVYPLLPLTDLLITDYSSIYMDYLLLEKPVVFFPYDYDSYIKNDRELQFDYDWITPGPKYHMQEELEVGIIEMLIEGKDEYSERRKEILNLAFKYKDGNSSQRIWNYIKEKYLSEPQGK